MTREAQMTIGTFILKTFDGRGKPVELMAEDVDVAVRFHPADCDIVSVKPWMPVTLSDGEDKNPITLTVQPTQDISPFLTHYQLEHLKTACALA